MKFFQNNFFILLFGNGTFQEKIWAIFYTPKWYNIAFTIDNWAIWISDVFRNLMVITMFVKFCVRERFITFMKNYFPKVILFEKIVERYNWKLQFFLDFWQPVFLQLGWIGKKGILFTSGLLHCIICTFQKLTLLIKE